LQSRNRLYSGLPGGVGFRPGYKLTLSAFPALSHNKGSFAQPHRGGSAHGSGIHFYYGDRFSPEPRAAQQFRRDGTAEHDAALPGQTEIIG